jgi:hypothetical protein
MLTPPASAASPTPSFTSHASASDILPTARKHPLAQGSPKEIKLIHYLDGQLSRAYRRYEKRLPEEQQSDTTRQAQDDAPGYKNMDEVVADLDPLIDVVWISHTRECSQRFATSVVLRCSDSCAVDLGGMLATPAHFFDKMTTLTPVML